MSRPTTDGDVAFLVGRLSRTFVSVAQAQAEGFGPSSNAGRSVSEVMAALLKTSIPDASRELADDISDYYLAVYRHMIARGSPEGIEIPWLAAADLIRSVGDAYTDVGGAQPRDRETVDHQELLRKTQPDIDQLHMIARFVDPALATEAQSTMEAVLKSLAHEAGANPLSAEDQQLLQLLISGRTIDEIAAHLNVSGRTIHRRLQAVWDHVGAVSRTQGIAIVSAGGWLD